MHSQHNKTEHLTVFQRYQNISAYNHDNSPVNCRVLFPFLMLSTLSQHKHLTQGLGRVRKLQQTSETPHLYTGLSPRLCCLPHPPSNQEHYLLQEGIDTQRAASISISAEKLLLSPTFTSGATVPRCFTTRPRILKTVYLQTELPAALPLSHLICCLLDLTVMQTWVTEVSLIEMLAVRHTKAQCIKGA